MRREVVKGGLEKEKRNIFEVRRTTTRKPRATPWVSLTIIHPLCADKGQALKG
ncbi:MAG: hypothetical protein QGG87_07065 [Nitrospinota bacterium]|nr:hypothetical protein [Nitrospinota bacterium]